MSARTRYYVRIMKPVYMWVEVNAITKDEAREEASKMKEVISVIDVKHWTEFEEVDGC